MNTSACQRINGTKPQRGVSLLIIMVLMLTISLMTLTAFYMGRNQFHLVGNIQHVEQAFSNAESVVAQGETWLNFNAESTGFTAYDASLKGIYPKDKMSELQLDRKTMVWDDSNSILFTDTNGNSGRYVIEQLADKVPLSDYSFQNSNGQAFSICKSVNIYQVTGQAIFRNASRTVETIFTAEADCSK